MTATLAPSPLTGYAFTSADIAKATEARRQKAEEDEGNRQLHLTEQRAKRAYVDALVEEWQQGDIGQTALTAAFQALTTIAEAIPTIEITSSLDLVRVAQAAEVFFKMYRLEAGLSTSNTLSASVDADQVATRLAALQARAAELQTSGTDIPEQ